MTDSTIQLGVLANIQRKPGRNDSTYVTAWIERQVSREVFLHQNNLIDRQAIAELADGRLVFFDTQIKQLDKGERIDAVRCSLAQPAGLLDYLLALDVAASHQLGKQSSPAFRRALLHELEKLIADTADLQVATRLTAIRRELLPQEDASPATPTSATAPILAPQPEATAPSFSESAFLHHVFTANSPDYASRLFPLLVEGIRAISDDDSFRQALFLLEFNSQLTEGKVPNLHTTFYMLAAPAYRFQFWLRGLVPFCDTDTLFAEFANGSETLKKRVLERCQGDAAVLLAPAATPVTAPVIQAYLTNIKAGILEQLITAQATIQIAVAWFTHDEFFAVLCEKLQQGVEVELVINNDYINNWEFGLPFTDFIALGGKLYLSEHPAMMHHKFCLIDEAILFTGSFNWTYYADLHNDENALRVQNSPEVVALFKAEFERLKQHIGSPVTSITPFPAEELKRFERINFRGYLSKDVHSRVTYTQKIRPTADPQRLATLLTQAIKIDDRNEDARQLLQDVAPAAIIDSYAVRAQQAVRQQSSVTAPIPEPLPGTEPTLPPLASPTPAPAAVASTSSPTATPPAAPTQQPIPKPAAPGPIPTVPATAPVSQHRPASTPRPVAAAPTRSITIPTTTSSVTAPIAKPIPLPPSLPQQPVNTSISIPDSKRTIAQYENLHLVFALDYSNSMESMGQGHGGYKLYSTGKIQQVINVIFGVAKGLTTNEKVDMFLFEQKAIQLPEVTEKNYASYVQDVVRKHEMHGTNIYAPIQAIHEKYAADSVAKTGVFVILITDGENNEEADNAKIKAHFAANYDTPIFWQFVGLGADFKFLEEVADTPSNAAFFSLNDVQSVSNDTLLERLLQKFPQWVEGLQPIT